MDDSYSRLSLVLIGTLVFTGCSDENGNFSVGVSLGGTGTGGAQGPVPKPKPDPADDDVEYAVAYPNPVIQYCDGIERTIQFVRHYPPFIPMKMGDRMDLLSIKNSLKVRYKLQVIIKNTTSAPIYEYINSCEASFQLTGTKTAKKTETDYCLNDETVNTYQPNESKTYYYAFNLPNILQNWTVNYNAQYSKQLYASNYDDENLNTRTQCDPLSTILLIDEYPSTKDGAPQGYEKEDDSGSNNGEEIIDTPPVFGGFGLMDES